MVTAVGCMFMWDNHRDSRLGTVVQDQPNVQPFNP